MAKLSYVAIASLDGYIEDSQGRFDWAEPDEVLHAFVNDLVRPAGTFLYGRRMYETMMVWETDPGFAADAAVMRDFAQIWQAAEKIVYSRTLVAAPTSKTRIERGFDPDGVREMKAAAGQTLMIGGPGLAAHAFQAGLVDECHLLLAPVSVGSGKPALPNNQRLMLALVEERRFGSGFVYLHYQIRQ